MRSRPPASTATVPVARLARCAAASMPRARPETIDEAGLAELAREPLGEFRPAAEALREPTIATIGREQHRELAAHRDERRRVVDRGEPLRIGRLAERDERHAEPARRLELALGVGARTDADARARRRGAPAPAARRARRARRR